MHSDFLRLIVLMTVLRKMTFPRYLRLESFPPKHFYNFLMRSREKGQLIQTGFTDCRRADFTDSGPTVSSVRAKHLAREESFQHGSENVCNREQHQTLNLLLEQSTV